MSRKRMKALICIAHPDDEVLFFGGLISSHKYDWTIVCATDANADGLGAERKKRFHRSCKLLGINTILHFDFPDIFDKRIDIGAMISKLKRLPDKFDIIFTHGPLGEYGHRHHQDVCYAVHKSFSGHKKIYSASYNTFPELRLEINKKIFDLKTKIMWKVYSEETKGLMHFLPATTYESFVRIGEKEVDELYMVVTDQKVLNKKNLKAYSWLYEYIDGKNYELKARIF